MLAFREPFQSASRHEKRIDVSITVVVEQRRPAAECFDNVVLSVVPAAIKDVCQARLHGNVREDRRIVQRRDWRHYRYGRGQQSEEQVDFRHPVIAEGRCKRGIERYGASAPDSFARSRWMRATCACRARSSFSLNWRN